MEPIEFYGSNVVIAKDQPAYRPLPAHVSPDGDVVTCWRLSWWERLKLLARGHLWLKMKTFNAPLQPVLLSVERTGP